MGNSGNERKNNIFFTDLMNNDADFLPVITDSNDEEMPNLQMPEILPILPLRNTVLFPGVIIPITVGRQKSLRLIQDTNGSDKLLGAIAQIDSNKEDPQPDELYKTGTIAEILKILEMPDGTTTIIIQGKRRFQVREFVADAPYFKAKIDSLTETIPVKNK
ncbi:MAG: LON peptidase substrate-binding domain-containing protein, partial [Prolixibacteraceae bacterium]|nr:LON peptidase substrate-binding domain-containing protein [Prolixibacteraceae bacterium]